MNLFLLLSHNSIGTDNPVSSLTCQSIKQMDNSQVLYSTQWVKLVQQALLTLPGAPDVHPQFLVWFVLLNL